MRKCPVCGKEIPEDAHASRKYCSIACKRQVEKLGRRQFAPRIIECAYCGKEFLKKTERQKFCSQECCRLGTKYQRLYIVPEKDPGGERQCQYCGNWFRPEHGRPTCCSHECKNKLEVLALRRHIEEQRTGILKLHFYCTNCDTRYGYTGTKDSKVPKEFFCPACQRHIRDGKPYGGNPVRRVIKHIPKPPTLDETIRLAKAAGMSYGKYRAQQFLKEQKESRK